MVPLVPSLFTSVHEWQENPNGRGNFSMAVSSDEEGEAEAPLSPPPRTDGLIPELKMPTFTPLDGVFMIISMATFVADIATGEHDATLLVVILHIL